MTKPKTPRDGAGRFDETGAPEPARPQSTGRGERVAKDRLEEALKGRAMTREGGE